MFSIRLPSGVRFPGKSGRVRFVIWRKSRTFTNRRTKTRRLKSEVSYDNDVQLWNEFRSGSKASFGRLIRAHYRSLYAYAKKFRKDQEFVKDCLQDLFLELWKNRSNLGATPYVRSYLFKSVRNKMVRALQQNKWHLQTTPIDENYQFQVEFSIEHHLIREQTLRDTTLRISRILNALPKRQKEIIYLRFYENLEIAEIVEIMGINRQSAYNLIHKAIENLQTQIKPHSLLVSDPSNTSSA